jgi:hypothetical protein
MARRWCGLAVAFLVSPIGLAGAEDAAAPASPPPATQPGASAALPGAPPSADALPLSHPGRIVVSTSPIHGWQGMNLVVRATATSGTVGARLCAPVTSDDFSLPSNELLEPPPDQDPCGAAAPAVEFPPGDAFVSARIVRPGEHEPLSSVVTTVTVNGDAHVTLDGARLSRHEHKHAATPTHP